MLCPGEMEQDRVEEAREPVVAPGRAKVEVAWAVLVLVRAAVVYARVAGKRFRINAVCRAPSLSVQTAVAT